jgi:phosphoserine phosphatase RsbU/P
MDTPDPAEVLARLDRKMQHFEPEALATVLYAVIGPPFDQARISSAGHYPPVLVSPGRSAELAEITTDLMIGAAPAVRRRATTVQIPPGALLCFYTDGLIERRDRPIDDGLARLCAAVTAGQPEVVCASVMGAMIGREPARDDVALLIFRRSS